MGATPVTRAPKTVKNVDACIEMLRNVDALEEVKQFIDNHPNRINEIGYSYEWKNVNLSQ